MSKFSDYLKHRFGIILPDNLFIEERTNNVYVFNSDLLRINYGRMQRKGMLAAKLDTLYGIKPSLNFVLQFGHLASMNYVVLDSREDVLKVYGNRNITCGSECNCTYGLVIFKDKLGRGVGIGVKMKEYIKPLIPKSRLVSYDK